MDYNELHALFNSRLTLDADGAGFPETGQTVANFTFVSSAAGLLDNVSPAEPFPAGAPGPGGPGDGADRELVNGLATARDSGIRENREFRYHVLAPEGGRPAAGAIILLHGLNERGWAKYLPWASELSRGTGKAVILFPIAFHMNRGPALWNDPRPMRRVSRLRMKAYPDLLHSALSNAAISVRLTADPARFYWSGLQTYMDVTALAARIRGGGHPLVAAGAGVDLFTYSVGSFLGEILLCAGRQGPFSESRLIAFCGGPVFNRLSPSSKFIVDSETSVRLHSCLVEHLESRMKASPALGGSLSPGPDGAWTPGRWFRAFLDYRLDRERRESRLRELCPRIAATALEGDMVVPPVDVTDTFRGAARDIPVPVEVMSPDYPCRHEDPFPAGGGKAAGAVDACFKKTFEGFSAFLR